MEKQINLKTYQQTINDQQYDQYHKSQQQIDMINVLIKNIKSYCSMLIQNIQEEHFLKQCQSIIIKQLSYFQQLKQTVILDSKNLFKQIEGYQCFNNINSFQMILRSLYSLKNKAYNQGKQYGVFDTMINGFLQQMVIIISERQTTIKRLQKYDVYANNINNTDLYQQQQQESKNNNHFSMELITFQKYLPPQTFEWVYPPLHRLYLSEVTRAYHDICPIKIKYIVQPNIKLQDHPQINLKNYFNNDCQKMILCYPIVGTKMVGKYYLDQIHKLLTFTKQYYHQQNYTIDWVFSTATRTIVTPQGKIYAFCCQQTQTNVDQLIYQIGEKIVIKGKIPKPKRQSSYIYLNGYIYVIGGSGINQPCSKKNYKYSIKQKKWSQIKQSYIALKRPTICTYNNRYIVKIGGLNQFDYINKTLELYDSINNTWSLVRGIPKNIMEEIEILQNSLSVQINSNQIYVFSGKNNNKFNSDTGFILNILSQQSSKNQITSELWNVSIGPRNILSFCGLFSPSNTIIHENCIYALRVSIPTNFL